MPLTIDTEMDENGQCPIRAILTTVMGKWSSLILLSLKGGSLRFSEIKRGVGDITQRVLTENLRALERDGYLTRTVIPGPPIEVHYELTGLGGEFVQHYMPLVRWATDRREAVLAARENWEQK
ncbi:winged helix-turn-helix transcriptional regulator [Ruegeria jejuensis]|uniref:winged helix-turn-helix transcriptional regulator n=1 Tax=Ruegeria jejuensis TaxID=3233338 RepID=UPI00355BA7C2